MVFQRVMTDPFGRIVISVILGLGLAALFRRACSGDGCVVIQSPDSKDVNDYVYRINSACYKYSPNVIPCPMKGAKDPVGSADVGGRNEGPASF